MRTKSTHTNLQKANFGEASSEDITDVRDYYEMIPALEEDPKHRQNNNRPAGLARNKLTTMATKCHISALTKQPSSEWILVEGQQDLSANMKPESAARLNKSKDSQRAKDPDAMEEGFDMIQRSEAIDVGIRMDEYMVVGWEDLVAGEIPDEV